MRVRRRLIGPLMLVLGATAHAAPPSRALAEEPPVRLALRPSFDPSGTDAPARAETAGLFVTPSVAPNSAEAEADEPTRRNFATGPAQDAPHTPAWIDDTLWTAAPLDPASFENPHAALAPPIVSAEDLDARLRRAAGAGWMEYQYILGSAHFPAWVGAASTLDALRRQDNANWRQKWAWTPRSGWEAEFAPANGVMLGARSYYSPGIDRTLLESKLGFAVVEGFPFAAQATPVLYVGPFLTADGLHFDGGAKLGAHVTFGQVGLFHLTLAAGLARDRWGAPGTFALFQSSVRF
jgi:hypothetical protein